MYSPLRQLFREKTSPVWKGYEKGAGVSELGAVNVMTGIYRPFSQDKFIVMDENSKDTVCGLPTVQNDNHPASPGSMGCCDMLRRNINKRLLRGGCILPRCQQKDTHMAIRFVMGEVAWQAHFTSPYMLSSPPLRAGL